MLHRFDRRLARAVRHALICGGVLGLGAPALAANPPATTPPPAGMQVAGQSDGAAAQDAAPQARNGKKPKPQTNGEATSLAAMVVTAQSRKQEVENVPIAVQVVDSRTIQEHAATDIGKMDMFIPGLVVSAEQPTQPSYQIRGIGGSGFGVGTDSAVGVYVDGVYAARSGGALLAFNDVKRIEVLKGPQGTLFGRNSAAGAISIITNKPSDHFEARARLRVGNHGERYGSVLLNLPAGDDMAFRINLLDNQSDGWVTDADSGRHYGRNDDWGSRISWRWNLSDSTQFVLDWEHERLNQPPRPAFGIVELSDDTHQRPPYPPDPATYVDPRHAPLRNDAIGGKETRRFDGVTLHLDHYMDWGTLTSISAYRHFTTANPADFDGTNHIVSHLDEVNRENNSSWYQELKLSGDTDLASWVAGVSAYRENARQSNGVQLYTDSIDSMVLNLGIPTGTPDGTLYHYFSQVLAANHLPYTLLGERWDERIGNRGRYASYAIYGDVIWHLGDRINLTTGARLTRDKKTFSWYNAPRIAPGLDQTLNALQLMGVFAMAGVDPSVFRQNLVFTDAVGQPVETSNTWNDFSPRVVLDDHFTDHVMGYVSVAKGYKAGGYNSVQVVSRFEPEQVWNYEAGIKSVFPDRHMVFNASVYHYRYSNLQSLQLITNTSSGVPAYLVSSSNEKANGAEIAWQWQPVRGLVLDANAAYIDSTYGDKHTAAGVDLSGQPTGIPRLSYALALQYTWHIEGGRLVFNLSHAYRGKYRCNDDSKLQGNCQVSPRFEVGTSTRRTDLRLGWHSPGDHWGLAAYVNNVFDKRYVESVGNVSTSVFGTPYASITPPRMYGVELEVKY